MSHRPVRVELIGLNGLPMFGAGSDVARELKSALGRGGIGLQHGDIVVVAQKIVSKAEGRTFQLGGFTPGERAIELAGVTGKDPRLVEAILTESVSVLRAQRDVLIVEHRLGHIMANAGIDQSNVGNEASDSESILLLPLDPDASAEALRRQLDPEGTLQLGIIISDSFGRAWRNGTTGVAIGAAAVPALDDRRGQPDLFGRALQVTEVGFADAVAASAVMVMGEGAEGCPAVVVRGMKWSPTAQTSRNLLRDRSRDMFR